MAVMEKTYEQSQSILLNVLYDIAEMRKTDVKRLDGERYLMNTEMYGIKTPYIFRLVPAGTGTSVAVETEVSQEGAEQNIELMFATIENMLGPFRKAQ